MILKPSLFLMKLLFKLMTMRMNSSLEQLKLVNHWNKWLKNMVQHSHHLLVIWYWYLSVTKSTKRKSSVDCYIILSHLAKAKIYNLLQKVLKLKQNTITDRDNWQIVLCSIWSVHSPKKLIKLNMKILTFFKF